MADLNTNVNITANGDYDTKVRKGRKFIFSASENFGGATVTLKYLVDGSEVPFENGELTSVGGFEVNPPTDDVRVTVSNGSSPSIKIVILDSHDFKR